MPFIVNQGDRQRVNDMAEALRVLQDRKALKKYVELNNHQEFIDLVRPEKIDFASEVFPGLMPAGSDEEVNNGIDPYDFEYDDIILPNQCTVPKVVRTETNSNTGECKLFLEWACSGADYAQVKKYTIVVKDEFKFDFFLT